MRDAGGAYYETAVELRAEARAAREELPGALERLRSPGPMPGQPNVAEAAVHAGALIVQAVGYELAAALWGFAQATEDAGWRGHARPTKPSGP